MILIHHFPGIFVTTFEVSMKYTKYNIGALFWVLAFIPLSAIQEIKFTLKPYESHKDLILMNIINFL